MTSPHPFAKVATSLQLATIAPLCDVVLSTWLGPVEGLHEACLVVDADTLDVQTDFVTVVADLVMSYPDGIRHGIRVQLSGDTEQEGVTTDYTVNAIRIHAPTAVPVHAAPLPDNPLDRVEPEHTGPRTVIVTIADTSETMGPLEPLRAGDQLRMMHKLTLHRLEAEDGSEPIIVTGFEMLYGSLPGAEGILLPDALHDALLARALLVGSPRIDEVAVVLVPLPTPFRIDWATVTHKIVGHCNHDGLMSYVRS